MFGNHEFKITVTSSRCQWVKKSLHNAILYNLCNKNITYTNDDHDHWGFIASLGHNELKISISTFHVYTTNIKHLHSNVQSTHLWELTHWGPDKLAAVSQTTVSNALYWMKMYEFRLRFHWHLFLRVQLRIFQHWFRSWLGADQATSHDLNQWWLVYWRIYASLGLNELMITITMV